MPPSLAAIAEVNSTWKALDSRLGFRLRYVVVGQGARTWVAFHGFGQTPLDMLAWAEPLLEQGGRMILVELPWHGESLGPDPDASITPEDWRDWFAQLCRREQVNTFRLFGFSLGARLALLTACQMKATVEQLVLCAPDGVTNSLWFTLGTQSAVGRSLFRRITNDPAPLFRLAAILHKLGLVNRSLKRFVEKEMAVQARREMAYRAWQSMRLIPPEMEDVATIANKWSIPVVLFFGRHDRIIPVRRGRPLITLLRHCQVHLLDCGHNALPILAGRIQAALEGVNL